MAALAGTTVDGEPAEGIGAAVVALCAALVFPSFCAEPVCEFLFVLAAVAAVPAELPFVAPLPFVGAGAFEGVLLFCPGDALANEFPEVVLGNACSGGFPAGKFCRNCCEAELRESLNQPRADCARSLSLNGGFEDDDGKTAGCRAGATP